MMRTGTTAAEDATPKVERMEIVRRMLCEYGSGGRGEVSSSPQDDDVSERATVLTACVLVFFFFFLLFFFWMV